MIVITARVPGPDGTPGAGPQQQFTLVPGEGAAQTVAGWRYMMEPAGYVYVGYVDTEAGPDPENPNPPDGQGGVLEPFGIIPPEETETWGTGPVLTYSEETPAPNYLPFIVGGLVLLLLLRPSRAPREA